MSEDVQNLVAALAEKKPDQKPKVDDLAKWAGVEKVSAAERDAAWQQYQQTQAPGGVDPEQKKEAACLRVRTTAPGRRRRRAGFAFTDQPISIALDALTKERMQQIEKDRQLKAERVTAVPDVTEA